MSGVLQGVVVLLVGSAIVYYLLMAVGSNKAAGESHGHDSHGGHGHH